ncbi:MAG: DUF6443 domain-containing protein, partial [Mucilaginibacter sp.]
MPLSASPSVNQNYILTSIPRNAGVNPAAGNSTTCDMMQTVQYFDGLGRLTQTVQVKGNQDGTKDLIQPVVYDEYGREAIKYLPYTEGTSAPGSYRTDAVTGVMNFYYPSGSTALPGTQQNNGIVFNQYPFAQAGLEASPLDRPLEQGAPGAPWQLGTHTVKMAYLNNDQSNFTSVINNNPGSRKVALYTATINADNTRTLGRVNNTATYASNQLFATISKDENWQNTDGCLGTVEEYKDKEDHVVLKRTYNKTKDSGGNDIVEMLSTYYIYDDLGNLCFVLTPKSSPDATGAAMSQTTLDNLCYQYQYDERNRLVKKKIPGKGWEYMVYNKLDQLVATQEAIQRAKSSQEWTVTKYDAIGRTVATGIYQYGTTAGQDYSGDIKTQAYGTTTFWEKPTGVTSNNGYSNTSFPISPLSTTLTINYYDDYRFDGSNPYPFAGGISQPTGLQTGVKINILGTASMLWTISYYDAKGRNIQTYKQHYLGGAVSANNYDDVFSEYNDFTSELKTVTRRHYVNSGTSKVLAVIIANRYEYDHLGRKISSFQRTGAAGAPEVLIAKDDYNEVGQLWKKGLHSENNGNSFLQQITSTYNERGWLLAAGDNNSLFNYSLAYNEPTTGVSKQYNGNIAQMGYTRTGQSNVTFSYGYDPLNRLKTSSTATGGSTLGETITYDVMGNITSLVRTGNRAASLAYAYYNGGQDNRLQTVTNNGSAFRSYSYDANGNATTDGGSKGITYNLLNLPQLVKNGSTTVATYVYDATGTKLRNISTTGTGETWDYIGGIVYQNGGISFISTEEGRAHIVGGVYSYEYNLKDHLGNVRLSFDKNPTTGAVRRIQEDEYYAFGLRNTGGYDFSNNNRYLYNGKEIQTDLTDQYDYGARFYDPVIGRFTTVDPSARSYVSLSPYNYVNNNPVGS